MALKEFELFHGSVLTQLVRRGSKVTLSLVETDRDSWAIYRVNDIDFFIKHSASPRALTSQRHKGGKSWVFSFAGKQLAQVKSKKPHVVLVCGNQTKTDHNTGICFLKREQMKELLADGTQNITVRLVPNKSFRVTSSTVSQELVIPRSALEKFEIPL